jgi:hypothetical protein
VRIISTDPQHPGVFAFGQVAVGVIAFGQAALGVVAIGQLARGVFCLGQGAIGVVAVGQGAIGLWHGTGMLAIAGARGYGLALHLLPLLVRERAPELPAETPLSALLDRSASGGWLRATLTASGGLDPDDVGARIDASAIESRLKLGATAKADRAHVKVRANVIPDASGYREGRAHVELVAEDVITYPSHPRSHLAYGTPPKGSAGAPTTPLMIAVRTLVWLIALVLVSLVSFIPLFEALTE